MSDRDQKRDAIAAQLMQASQTLDRLSGSGSTSDYSLPRQEGRGVMSDMDLELAKRTMPGREPGMGPMSDYGIGREDPRAAGQGAMSDMDRQQYEQAMPQPQGDVTQQGPGPISDFEQQLAGGGPPQLSDTPQPLPLRGGGVMSDYDIEQFRRR